MKFKYLAVIGAFIGMLTTASFSQESPTLGQFLDAFPGVAHFISSKECYHPSTKDAYAEINGKKYEVRYVTYTTNGDNSHHSLGNFIAEHDLRAMEGKLTPINPYVTILAFIQPNEIKEKGTYFTISFRPVD